MGDPIYERMASGEPFTNGDLIALCNPSSKIISPEQHIRSWDACGFIALCGDGAWVLTKKGQVETLRMRRMLDASVH